jgi:BASS family bile acid:Na+ symporter
MPEPAASASIIPISVIEFVNFNAVPVGLMVIMFSLGLSLTLADFKRLAKSPQPVLVGLFGQLAALPLLGLVVAALFALPAPMAVGLFILAASPAGVTSNGLTYAARANVALAVTLTAFSSVITVFSTPLLVKWALTFYYTAGNVPQMSILNTIYQLVKITVIPIAIGMFVRRLWPEWSIRAEVWLRPTSLVIIILVVVSSMLVNFEMVMEHLFTAGPAAWVLNVTAMATGYLLAALFRLDHQDRLTLSIEVGVQNATLAMFITMSVLGSLEIALIPTIYGLLMVFNATVLIHYLKWKARQSAQKA